MFSLYTHFIINHVKVLKIPSNHFDWIYAIPTFLRNTLDYIAIRLVGDKMPAEEKRRHTSACV